MEKLRNFVENMFSGLPDTPEVREAKAHILEGMEDRYEALLSQGKNENEALGIVMGEFGSVEELRQELNLPAEAPRAALPQDEAEDLLREYTDFQKRFPVAITAGVVLCILGVALSELLRRSGIGSEVRLHHIVFLGMLAVAVGIFVYFGIQENGYKRRIRLVQGTPASPGEKEDDDPVSGFIMLTATAVYLAIGFFWNLWHPGWIVFILGAALCSLAGMYRKK